MFDLISDFSVNVDNLIKRKLNMRFNINIMK